MVVVVRDAGGKLQYIYGVLTSYNEFGALVLESAYERIIRGDATAMRRLGATVVRGETVVLLGTVSATRLAARDAGLRAADLREMEAADRAEWEAAEEKAKLRSELGCASVCGFDDSFY